MNGPLRVLVTGANGQVGHELLRALAEGVIPLSPPSQAKGEGSNTPFRRKGVAAQQRGDVKTRWKIIPATRDGLLANGSTCERIDLTDLDGLTRALDRIHPDVIINAAAYTVVDRAEDEPELAQRVNGDALGVLGGWAARNDARVIHYSTDYVFDGTATRPYRESDAPHPVSAYGRSKLAGEVALRDSGARYLILRTAWVYAARGHNFLRTMLRLGAERDALRVVDEQFGAPSPAGLIAKVTAQVLAIWCNDPAPAHDGVYHLVAAGQTSWCGFARAIFERARQAGLMEHAPRVDAITTVDYPTQAMRPAYSVLDTTKLRETFGMDLPDWKTALDDVIRALSHR